MTPTDRAVVKELIEALKPFADAKDIAWFGSSQVPNLKNTFKFSVQATANDIQCFARAQEAIDKARTHFGGMV